MYVYIGVLYTKRFKVISIYAIVTTQNIKMELELEAKFLEIDENKIRIKLSKIGAKLMRPRFKQERAVFYLPKGHEMNGGWVRVRDEGDKITMSLKVVDGNNIDNQKETMVIVDNFETTVSFLKSIGCIQKGFQITYRELWELNDAEICIDEWPFLKPYIEIEAKSEEAVKAVAEKLELSWEEAFWKCK